MKASPHRPTKAPHRSGAFVQYSNKWGGSYSQRGTLKWAVGQSQCLWAWSSSCCYGYPG